MGGAPSEVSKSSVMKIKTLVANLTTAGPNSSFVIPASPCNDRVNDNLNLRPPIVLRTTLMRIRVLLCLVIAVDGFVASVNRAFDMVVASAHTPNLYGSSPICF